MCDARDRVESCAVLLSCAVKVCLADGLAVALNPLGDAEDVGTASAHDEMSIRAATCKSAAARSRPLCVLPEQAESLLAQTEGQGSLMQVHHSSVQADTWHRLWTSA